MIDDEPIGRRADGEAEELRTKGATAMASRGHFRENLGWYFSTQSFCHKLMCMYIYIYIYIYIYVQMNVNIDTIPYVYIYIFM